MSTLNIRKSPLFRFIAFTVLFAFAGMLPVQPSYAQVAFVMPPAGQMIHITHHFEPPQMLGLKVNMKDPFSFDFIMDQGESHMSDTDQQEEFNKIIKYFLVSLTMPNKEMWVNLSPYESNRIIPEVFGQTEMGRDLLAQDYILKQFTASLMYPEEGLGKTFWNKVYSQAQARFGTTDINVNTFNKVWIVADHADVYQKGDTAFLVASHLKVMLEQDFMAIEKNNEQFGNVRALADINKDEKTKMASEVVREIIIPAIEKEVNEGKNFAAVRQVYNAEIMATWFKKTLRESLLGQVFADKSKVSGQKADDPQAKEKIYKQYLRAYKKGVFNYIKEDPTPDGQIIPRKYFSGGSVPVAFETEETFTDKDLKSSPQAKQEVSFAMTAMTHKPGMKLVTAAFLAAGMFFATAQAHASPSLLYHHRHDTNTTQAAHTQKARPIASKPFEKALAAGELVKGAFGDITLGEGQKEMTIRVKPSFLNELGFASFGVTVAPEILIGEELLRKGEAFAFKPDGCYIGKHKVFLFEYDGHLYYVESSDQTAGPDVVIPAAVAEIDRAKAKAKEPAKQKAEEKVTAVRTEVQGGIEATDARVKKFAGLFHKKGKPEAAPAAAPTATTTAPATEETVPPAFDFSDFTLQLQQPELPTFPPAKRVLLAPQQPIETESLPAAPLEPAPIQQFDVAARNMVPPSVPAATAVSATTASATAEETATTTESSDYLFTQEAPDFTGWTLDAVSTGVEQATAVQEGQLATTEAAAPMVPASGTGISNPGPGTTPAANNIPPAPTQAQVPPASKNIPPAPKNVPPAPKNIPPAPKNVPPAPKNIPPAPTQSELAKILEALNSQSDLAKILEALAALGLLGGVATGTVKAFQKKSELAAEMAKEEEKKEARAAAAARKAAAKKVKAVRNMLSYKDADNAANEISSVVRPLLSRGNGRSDILGILAQLNALRAGNINDETKMIAWQDKLQRLLQSLRQSGVLNGNDYTRLIGLLNPPSAPPAYVAAPRGAANPSAPIVPSTPITANPGPIVPVPTVQSTTRVALVEAPKVKVPAPAKVVIPATPQEAAQNLADARKTFAEEGSSGNWRDGSSARSMVNFQKALYGALVVAQKHTPGLLQTEADTVRERLQKNQMDYDSFWNPKNKYDRYAEDYLAQSEKNLIEAMNVLADALLPVLNSQEVAVQVPTPATSPQPTPVVPVTASTVNAEQTSQVAANAQQMRQSKEERVSVVNLIQGKIDDKISAIKASAEGASAEGQKMAQRLENFKYYLEGFKVVDHRLNDMFGNIPLAEFINTATNEPESFTWYLKEYHGIEYDEATGEFIKPAAVNYNRLEILNEIAGQLSIRRFVKTEAVSANLDIAKTFLAGYLEFLNNINNDIDNVSKELKDVFGINLDELGILYNRDTQRFERAAAPAAAANVEQAAAPAPTVGVGDLGPVDTINVESPNLEPPNVESSEAAAQVPAETSAEQTTTEGRNNIVKAVANQLDKLPFSDIGNVRRINQLMGTWAENPTALRQDIWERSLRQRFIKFGIPYVYNADTHSFMPSAVLPEVATVNEGITKLDQQIRDTPDQSAVLNQERSDLIDYRNMLEHIDSLKQKIMALEDLSDAKTAVPLGNFMDNSLKLLAQMEQNPAVKRIADAVRNVGGINLSDEHLTINIKVDGSGMPLPARFQDKTMLNLDGLTSIIRKISPVTPESVPALYELVGQG